MSKGIRPCARCGIKRQARPASVTCQDCKDVLTRDEYALWVAQDKKDRIRQLECRIDAIRRAA